MYRTRWASAKHYVALIVPIHPGGYEATNSVTTATLYCKKHMQTAPLTCYFPPREGDRHIMLSFQEC